MPQRGIRPPEARRLATVGRAIAPAGASAGSAEAVDLRDGGSAFGGLDVRRALANVKGDIALALKDLDAADQAAVDAALIALDGTRTKRRLGGNATIAEALHWTAEVYRAAGALLKSRGRPTRRAGRDLPRDGSGLVFWVTPR